MTEKRAFKGVWIPKEIFDDENLSPTQKILLAEIDSLDDGGGCYASNAFLAKRISSSKDSVANILSDLRQRGYIIDRGFNGRFAKRSVAIRSAPTAEQQTIKPPLIPDVNAGLSNVKPAFNQREQESTEENMEGFIPSGPDDNDNKPIVKALAFEVCNLWSERLGGKLNVGRAIRALKPIVESGASEEETVKSFAAYLRQTESKYASVEAWASKWRAFLPTGVKEPAQVHDPHSD